MTFVERTLKRRQIRPYYDGSHFSSLDYFKGKGSLYNSEYLDINSPHRLRFIDMSNWVKSYIPTGTVLDVGGGPGHFGYWAKKVAPSLTVVHTDYSEAALVHSTGNYAHTPVCVSAEALPFADESFDGVLFGDVLEHLQPETVERALNQTHAVLKKHGRVFINIPNLRAWSAKALKEPSHLWIPTIRDMQQILKYTGFSNSKHSTRGYPWSSSFRERFGYDPHGPSFGTSIFITAEKN